MSLVILMIKAFVAQFVKARLAGGLTDSDDELRRMTHSQPIFSAKNLLQGVARAESPRFDRDGRSEEETYCLKRGIRGFDGGDGDP